MGKPKHCPFCSGGTKDDHKPGLTASDGLWRVMCGYCDSSTGWRSSPEEAVEVWDKRFVCPDIEARLELLEIIEKLYPDKVIWAKKIIYEASGDKP